MKITDTLEDLDGQLVIAARWIDYDKPIVCVNYWPTGIRTRDFVRDYGLELPIEVRDNGGAQGSYTVPRPSWSWANPPLTVRLINGGRTEAVKQEQLPIPCPKVRAGIPTRFKNSRWEKYLKSQGWVTA